MAVLKQIKFGSTSTPIAMTQVAVQTGSALNVAVTGNGVDVDANPLYTIGLAVDGKTIAKGANGLETSLALKVEAASGSGQDAKKARIALVDSKGGEGYAELSSVNIEDIVGNGVISATSYDETTGILTITWAGGSTTAVNLGKLLDIDDIVVAQGSGDFLSFTLADPAAETGQAAIGVKLADVTYSAATGDDPANLTVSTTNGKILDASKAIPAIKNYVDAQTTDLAVRATGDVYVAANQATGDNKMVVVETNIQDLNASAGTPGVYGSDGSETTAPSAASLSGVPGSLVDGSDVATAVKTYVDGAIAIEAARSDAKNKADIAALDHNDAAVTGQFVTEVDETDGVIAVTRANLTDAVLVGFSGDTAATGDIAASDTLAGALNKLQNKVQYAISGTTLEFFGMTQHA
jgi:hypothetical protein